MRIALYPGSFDPVTRGHVDIAQRAAALFDQLVLGVFDTPAKNLLFTTEERVDLVKQAVSHLPNVTVRAYSCLTVEFVKEIGAKFIVRGLRMGSDFEREFDMALMNQRLDPQIDTVCLMSNAEYQFISSSLLKEVAEGGGNVNVFVPECVAVALKKKLFRPAKTS
ncbi:MAG: pantetheine-phosphate adenylyltransferase [Chloroflexi bacterium]|nr:MAG: pantetheine-phosphate adenylyltransferase [Chloroflexota bacterium]RLC96434.1 MAG: pantetheine-phosphate adenylyltransferase [Chloroflexota bacterium]